MNATGESSQKNETIIIIAHHLLSLVVQLHFVVSFIILCFNCLRSKQQYTVINYVPTVTSHTFFVPHLVTFIDYNNVLTTINAQWVDDKCTLCAQRGVTFHWKLTVFRCVLDLFGVSTSVDLNHTFPSTAVAIVHDTQAFMLTWISMQ